MKKEYLIALGLILALAVALPVAAKEFIDTKLVSQTDKLFATMPADFWLMDALAVQRLMETAKPLVIDVREKAEWDAGRIAGAVHIPIRELPKALDKLPDAKGAPIVVYCKIGHRGAMAMLVLREWGYTNVRSMRNGLDGWTAANLPVVTR